MEQVTNDTLNKLRYQIEEGIAEKVVAEKEVGDDTIYELKNMKTSLLEEFMKVLIDNKEEADLKEVLSVDGYNLYSLKHLINHVYGVNFKMPVIDSKTGLVVDTMVNHIIVYAFENKFDGAYMIRKYDWYSENHDNFESDAKKILTYLLKKGE